MEKDFLLLSVCRDHCSYYKPSKDEELACKGFLIIQQLVRNGEKITFKGRRVLDPCTEEALIRNMCGACPFHPEDCDFSMRREGSLPCGGFLVLGRLIEEGSLHIDVIRNML